MKRFSGHNAGELFDPPQLASKTADVKRRLPILAVL
jgi:hypothetical protein